MRFDPFGHVLDILNVTPAGEDVFMGNSLAMPNGRVFGGQVLAQALLACGRTVPLDRPPVSLHAYFLRPGRIDQPIRFEVERMRDGGSFSSRRAHAIQEGEPIFTATCSFQLDQPGLEHAEDMPAVPPPQDVPDSLDAAQAMNHPAWSYWKDTAAFDLRHPTGSPFYNAGQDTSRFQLVWAKARGPVPQESQLLQCALLAYASDLVAIEPLLRRHGLTLLSPGLSLASLDHAMWFHRPVDVSRWFLFSQRVTSMSGSRGLSAGTVFSADGDMVATFAQEAMVRLPA